MKKLSTEEKQMNNSRAGSGTVMGIAIAISTGFGIVNTLLEHYISAPKIKPIIKKEEKPILVGLNKNIYENPNQITIL